MRPQGSASVSESARSDILRGILSAGLTDTQQLYLTMYFRERLSMRDIAKRCGVNVSTVSRTISRASSRLKNAEELCRLITAASGRKQ
ncbi:MAG: helix-turn-helix domain-containing protein [Ruminococcus sp.]|nr:helix-turn-helix domain-containing protein [Ruminococcus sp.]